MTKLNSKIKQQFLIEIGGKIKQIRKQKGLTQSDLALIINGNNKEISRIERGEHNFGVVSLLILAKAFNIPVIELVKIENIDFFQKHI